MRYSAAQLHARTEVQTDGHWRVDFTGTPFARFGELLSMMMTSSNLPTPEPQTMNVKLHGFEFPQPGTVKRNGSISLQAVEGVDCGIIRPVYEWFNSIYSAGESDVQGVQTVEHQALFGDVIMSLQNKREDRVTQTYSLYRCIINGFEPGGELQDATDGVDYFKPRITLAYAWYNWGPGEARNL